MDVRVPSMGESVKSATIARWLKEPGAAVRLDEPLVALDSDKASVELPSPAAGVVGPHLAAPGEEVAIGQVIARIHEGAVAEAPPERSKPAPSGGPAGPAVRQAMHEAGVPADQVAGSGKGGRVTRADVEGARSAAPSAPRAVAEPSPAPLSGDDEPVEIVPMTSLRRRIAERLVEAQHTAAILTTFNEIDMSGAMALREKYQERFTKRYGIKLGYMAIFTKACIDALKEFPSANAEIRGTNIVYKQYYHVGVAVSGPRGLVVPVVRHADRLSFAETERAVAMYGQRAKDSALTVDDLQGGTFTISNGGVFGSMMSTPILNPPQVAILGMHAIQKRAMVVNDQIVIRPMMYVALSYDHRLLDGREAVSFLVRVKECVESPERMLLEV